MQPISPKIIPGKPVTTSVPSISIKFHANVEQIEEFYASEDESAAGTGKAEKLPAPSSSPSTTGDSESSPLRYLPRLGKRSTSVDVSQTQNLDASPPSDPWRFFSDIKGKITKSVEEKITDFKARNQEEGSPHHKAKGDLKTIKDSKENSSVSDSEDISESSISKTCGIVSTTEGVEMSSDDDTPSIEKDKKEEKQPPTPPPSSGGLSHRFRMFKQKSLVKEGTVKIKDLSKLYNINTEKVDQELPEDSEDVESAVDALEEPSLKAEPTESAKKTVSMEEVLRLVGQKIDNIQPDSENVINVKEVSGVEMRSSFFEGGDTKTVFAPTGFVDLRPVPVKDSPFSNYVSVLVLFLSITLYLLIYHYSPFLAGLAVGIILTYVGTQIYLKLYPLNVIAPVSPTENSLPSNKILEVQAIKEYQPLCKYEGWVNEYPEPYTPYAYHISKTQSVYLRLQGNLLRMSHSKGKVPKRAMWDEHEIKPNFTHQRIYNLLGAKVNLLPEGLSKKRHWSKKYPICVTLANEQMNFAPENHVKLEGDDEKDDKHTEKNKTQPTEKKSFRFRKREYPVLAQRFSKLTEDEEFDLESDSRASTPSADISDAALEDCPPPGEEDLLGKTNEHHEDDVNSLPEDWSMCSAPQPETPVGIKIYIFGRTDREKEDWFRRLCAATHKGAGVACTELGASEVKDTSSETLLEATQTELEYMKYMSVFKAPKRHPKQTKDGDRKATEPEQQEEREDGSRSDELLWLNAFIDRVLFDCVRDPSFTLKVRERIQRKLYTIKLPYFIEEILIPELSLGEDARVRAQDQQAGAGRAGPLGGPRRHLRGHDRADVTDQAEPDETEEPASLRRLEKSAIYHSDVDDSAESSSDEEGSHDIQSISQDSGTPAPSSAGNSGKKLIKMVDRIAESKFFQFATEYRVIQKAMEGVSNTDLRLTVEVKAIMGTLVLNIPPPPSDRVWVGFRPVPEIVLSARPVVGERNISYMMVTRWIEKKLLKEFQKIMVIPNMEDFVIPVMNPKLPE
ncbi:hypothetical protein NQ318_002778 [Aromia moschata]|uniref:Testis-expressed sequence 2 protein n=1 Tax=Aromia moschata TaxID=1265417 RepID=A0AAV8XU79_9CUCU|nr:hypothetical protein NQ318_002778 [Aromia moschata]